VTSSLTLQLQLGRLSREIVDQVVELAQTYKLEVTKTGMHSVLMERTSNTGLPTESYTVPDMITSYQPNRDSIVPQLTSSDIEEPLIKKKIWSHEKTVSKSEIRKTKKLRGSYKPSKPRNHYDSTHFDHKMPSNRHVLPKNTRLRTSRRHRHNQKHVDKDTGLYESSKPHKEGDDGMNIEYGMEDFESFRPNENDYRDCRHDDESFSEEADNEYGHYKEDQPETTTNDEGTFEQPTGNQEKPKKPKIILQEGDNLTDSVTFQADYEITKGLRGKPLKQRRNKINRK